MTTNSETNSQSKTPNQLQSLQSASCEPIPASLSLLARVLDCLRFAYHIASRLSEIPEGQFSQ